MTLCEGREWSEWKRTIDSGKGEVSRGKKDNMRTMHPEGRARQCGVSRQIHSTGISPMDRWSVAPSH